MRYLFSSPLISRLAFAILLVLCAIFVQSN